MGVGEGQAGRMGRAHRRSGAVSGAWGEVGGEEGAGGDRAGVGGGGLGGGIKLAAICNLTTRCH